MFTFFFKFLSSLISESNKTFLLKKMLNFMILGGDKKQNLRLLLNLDNEVYKLESWQAINVYKGIHPKHRLINYHIFFLQNIYKGEKVIDIGCGKGLVAYDLINKIPNIKIWGIDFNKNNINYAQKHFHRQGLVFIFGDATKDLPDGKFDTVILSNVLEHIKNRKDFLSKIIKRCNPKKLLIRVPIYNRDWRVALKKELDIEYHLDPTHETEYTVESFTKEMNSANLIIKSLEIKWGEIWSVIVTRSHF